MFHSMDVRLPVQNMLGHNAKQFLEKKIENCQNAYLTFFRWEGQTRKCLVKVVMAYGPRVARTVHHKRDPNISQPARPYLGKKY